jgi:hypothetical protein
MALVAGCGFIIGIGSGPDTDGWKLTEQNTGLANQGIDKGSLLAYTGPSKPSAGTTISNVKIDRPLDLSAGGITIEKCWIRPLPANFTKGQYIIVTYDNNKNQAPAPTPVTVKDCDIDGTAIDAETICGALGFSGSGTVQRCNIYGMGSGIGIWHTSASQSALIEGNYIHGLRAWGDPKTTGSHNDGFTIRDFIGPAVVVRNNRIDCSSGNDTGAFFIQPYSGPVDNLLAQGNLLEGNNYQMQLGQMNYDYGKNMRAVDNRFSGTGFGPSYVKRGSLAYGWAEWSDNYLNDPLKTGNKGAVVNAE